MGRIEDGPGIAPPLAIEEARATLRRLPLVVDDHGRDIILRAITLRLATLGNVESNDQKLYGHALTGIVAAWMEAEAERLRGSR